MRVVSCLWVLMAPALLCADFRESRPVRGVWLRPVGAAASALEPTLQSMTAAGLTDLYLETFYHGLTTGREGVFRKRFATDYLADAIRLGAKYGIRVSAWVESGYWQYGTTGQYLFDANPEYRVWNVSTNATGGDISGQVFANLCHPGVQAKMRAYAAELAAYPGLWGLQLDYHRFPLDNAPSDPYPSPWSYDAYSAATMRALYGATMDINTQAARTSHPYYNAFLTWRRAGITEAARQMRLGVGQAGGDLVVSAAVFPNPGAEIAKCQDWPAWAAAGTLDWVVPMAYSFTLNGISNDLSNTASRAAGRRIVPGLAITAGHPEVAQQLARVKSDGYEDFVLFDAPSALANGPAIRAWLDANATRMRADFVEDGVLDAKDWARFWEVYFGSAVLAGANARMDFDGDGWIGPADHARFRQALREYRLGDRGVFDARDAAAFEAARTAPGPGTGWTSYNHLYDFDGDGDADGSDRTWLDRFGNAHPMVFLRAELEGWEGGALPVRWEARQAGVLIASGAGMTDAARWSRLFLPVAGPLELWAKTPRGLSRRVQTDTTIGDARLPLAFRSGDCNDDDRVDLDDFLLLAASYETAAFGQDADLDGDGWIGLDDFLLLASSYGGEGE